MSSDIAKKLNNVKRYSTSLRRLFRFALGVVAVAFVVFLALLVFAPGKLDVPVNIIGIEYVGDPLSGTVGVLAHIGAILGLGVLIKFLFHLQKLFSLYAEGKIFTAHNVTQIRQIGVTLLLLPALWCLGLLEMLFVDSIVVSDARILVGSTPVGELIWGAVVIVVSWIMDVGRELREEQDLVV